MDQEPQRDEIQRRTDEIFSQAENLLRKPRTDDEAGKKNVLTRLFTTGPSVKKVKTEGLTEEEGKNKGSTPEKSTAESSDPAVNTALRDVFQTMSQMRLSSHGVANINKCAQERVVTEDLIGTRVDDGNLPPPIISAKADLAQLNQSYARALEHLSMLSACKTSGTALSEVMQKIMADTPNFPSEESLLKPTKRGHTKAKPTVSSSLPRGVERVMDDLAELTDKYFPFEKVAKEALNAEPIQDLEKLQKRVDIFCSIRGLLHEVMDSMKKGESKVMDGLTNKPPEADLQDPQCSKNDSSTLLTLVGMRILLRHIQAQLKVLAEENPGLVIPCMDEPLVKIADKDIPTKKFDSSTINAAKERQ